MTHSYRPSKGSKDFQTQDVAADAAVNETAAFNPITYSQGKLAQDFYSSHRASSNSNSTVNI